LLATPKAGFSRPPEVGNPYRRTTPYAASANTGRVPPPLDQAITLKKGIMRHHTHRYDLWIKVKNTKSEDEEQEVVKKALQKFQDIALQADPATVIPPYFALDRNDRTVPDLTSSFKVNTLDSFQLIKRYFSKLSNRNNKGNMYCSIIVTLNITFHEFMDKARTALINLDYGIFPKALDHEETADVGWFLYSTRYQDEEQLSEMLSTLIQERVGAKWGPIITNDRYRKYPEDPSKRTFAIHLEGSSQRVGIIRQKLSKWYTSKAGVFHDGTKMRLVPPFQSIISFNCKMKYASLVARQATLADRLCYGSTQELAANLVLDKPEPTTGLTLRQSILSIPSQIMSTKPLFHSVDRTWRSSTGITFTFIPENETDAHSFVVGLIPFIKATHSPWFIKFFSEEAQLQHLNST
jgi:hypothetical protein